MLKKERFREIVFKTYLRNHRESLLIARKLFNEKSSNLWVIVISYYSMFYLANALLYKIGYKIGPKVAHKVTADALIVFVKNKLRDNLIEEYELASGEALTLSDNILQGYDLERMKRAVFQNWPKTDILIMTAAVCDYTPVRFSPSKIKPITFCLINKGAIIFIF